MRLRGGTRVRPERCLRSQSRKTLMKRLVPRNTYRDVRHVDSQTSSASLKELLNKLFTSLTTTIAITSKFIMWIIPQFSKLPRHNLDILQDLTFIVLRATALARSVGEISGRKCSQSLQRFLTQQRKLKIKNYGRTRDR
jgi:hypothetical protein